LLDFENDKFYYQKKRSSEILSPIVQLIPETGPGSTRDQTKRFENFVEWAILKYPSKNYAIIIWGHGEGYIGKHYETQMRIENAQSRQSKNQTPRFLKEEDLNLFKNKESIPSTYPVDKVFGGVALSLVSLAYLVFRLSSFWF